MEKSNGDGDGDGDSFVSCSSSRDEKVTEAIDDLLEESWFFNNLLKKISTMMLRCNSDSCPSSSNTSFVERKEEGQDKDSNGTRKLTRHSSHKIMLQAPKLPSCNEEKESTSIWSKFGGQSPFRKLQKAPSLPPSIGKEDISYEENDNATRTSRLIQLAFASSAKSLHPSSKGMNQSYSIPRVRPPRSSEVESNNTNGIKEMSRRYRINQQKMSKKSLNDLETEEVQGFKDLGFTFEKKGLNPSVVNILPGLQEKKQEELSKDNKIMRPYLSEAWLLQSRDFPVPNCVPNNNSAEDMKAKLMFWARAVASNVRQEC